MEDFLVRWFILDMNLILERIVQGQIVEAKMNFILDGRGSRYRDRNLETHPYLDNLK